MGLPTGGQDGPVGLRILNIPRFGLREIAQIEENPGSHFVNSVPEDCQIAIEWLRACATGREPLVLPPPHNLQ
jgi:hypothetical protein